MPAISGGSMWPGGFVGGLCPEFTELLANWDSVLQARRSCWAVIFHTRIFRVEEKDVILYWVVVSNIFYVHPYLGK